MEVKLQTSVETAVSESRIQRQWFDKLHHATQLEKLNSTGISQHGIVIGSSWYCDLVEEVDRQTDERTERKSLSKATTQFTRLYLSVKTSWRYSLGIFNLNKCVNIVNHVVHVVLFDDLFLSVWITRVVIILLLYWFIYQTTCTYIMDPRAIQCYIVYLKEIDK